MYRAHWRLTHSPFRCRPDPKLVHASPTHEEALARLHFLVDEEHRLGLLLGPAGSGKSVVLEVFADELKRAGQPVAKLSLVGLEPAEFLAQTAAALGTNPGRQADLVALWRLLSDRIAELRYQRWHTVVLLDDADGASRTVLAHVLRLAKSEPEPESRLTLVLAAQPSRITRLGAALLDLADLRIDLEPWEFSETAEYVRSALARAGGNRPVFADAAIHRLHELTCGIPRRVNQLAELCLVAGAGRQLDQIDADTVESVCQELGLVGATLDGSTANQRTMN